MPPRVDIPSLLRRLDIKAKKAGQWFTALCPSPDHDDRNPSWRIHHDTGKHRCFSCGIHGGPIRLVMIVMGTSSQVAREWLDGEDIAAPQSLEVQLTFKSSARPRFHLPAGVIVAPLVTWPGPARDYISSRGVTAAQVQRWGLGYAVDGKQAGRVIFPVRDNRGVLVSYTGRSFTGARKKYREPDLEEGADLGAVFGEEFWEPEHDEFVIVTEGALDALAVDRVTGRPVAAMYGSQITSGHIARLSRWRSIVLATDADPAGDKVADTIRDALGRWTKIVRWRPPVGDDCASLALKSPSVLRDNLLGAWNAVAS